MISDDLKISILQFFFSGSESKERLDWNDLNSPLYKFLWEVTAWDKKFKGIDKVKQKKVISYNYLLSKELQDLARPNTNDVYLLSTGMFEGYTSFDLAKELYSDGEVVTIPWGGSPYVKYYKGKFITSDNRIATSIDTDVLDNKYLYYYMCSQVKYLESIYRGTGLKHPEMSKVLDMKIPVPSIKEQKRIVNKIDEIIPLIEKYNDSINFLTELTNNFRENLKRSVLLYAFSGELTKNSKDNSNELINQIMNHRISQLKDKKNEQYFSYKENEMIFEIPDRWKWVRLPFICDYIKAGGDKPKHFSKEKTKEFQVPVIANGEKNEGLFGFTDSATVTDKTITVSARGTIGYTVIRDYPYTPIVRLIVIKLVPYISYEYLRYFMKLVVETGNGGPIPQLTVPFLKNKLIPIAPVEEQEKIVEELDNLFSIIDKLK